MKITICIGSSCHLKGSREVVEGLQKMIARDGLKDKIELAGTFCLGKCQTGVNVLVDDERYSVSPDTVEEFYRTTVLPKLK
ncbi:MAG TPA: (2Fe-2S) ferredoxin domain-containing protein [Firmicutes bacterium]|nr:(2Fe-2S) ferredoxin domain-containing protein [Bacillota bacterium]